MHIICFHQTHPIFSPPTSSPSPTTFPSIFMCTLSLIPLSLFSVPVCAHAWDHLLSGTTSVMETDSPLQCPSVRGGTSWGPPPSMLGFWLTWVHICSPSQCEFTCATTMSCLANTVFWGRLFPVALAIFLLPIPWWFLSFGRKGCGTDVQFRAEYSEVCYSLNVDQLWVSELIAIYYKESSLIRVE